MRCWILILLAPCLAKADVETLVRRAETRLAHGNEEGARELYVRAIQEDPSCGPALAWLASQERDFDGISHHLRYLTDAHPLDASPAARFLLELGENVVDPSDLLLREAERAAMSDAPPGVEPFGPWRRWHDPDVVPPAAEAAGPLWAEAFTDEAHACRSALRRVAERFEREEVSSPAAWAALAVCLRGVREDDLADAALARAVPVTIEERLTVARCALKAARDPLAWWRANGQALVDALVAADVPEELHRPTEEVLQAAFDVLAAHRDLRAIASLAPALAATSAVGERFWHVDSLAGWISCHWPPDEAYEALAVDDSPSTRALRAALLARMGQDDRAVEVLEVLARENPDDLIAGDCLIGRRPSSTDGARARLALEAAAVRSGRRLSPSAAVACDSAEGLLSRQTQGVGRCRQVLRERPEWLGHFARQWRGRADFPELVDDLMAAAERLAGTRGTLDAGRSAELLTSLLEQRRPEDALRVIEMTAPDEFYRLLAGRDPTFRWSEVYGEIKPLISLMASRVRTGERVDAFLRYLARIEPGVQTPFAVWRLREDLAGDASFRALPSADFVLSCLHDPVVELEEVRRLQRSALRAGCRSSVLLIDLAEQGEPVLDELEAVDPVAARWQKARACSGEETLIAFLESDDLTQDQFREAQWELARRRSQAVDTQPWPPYRVYNRIEYRFQPPDAPSEDPARVVWGLLQEGPPSRWGLRHARQTRGLPPAVAEALHQWVGEDEAASEVVFRSHPNAADLARMKPSQSDPWKAAVAHVVESEGNAGIRALLSGTYGHAFAQEVLRVREGPPAGELAELVRQAGRAHPIDLQWLDVEDDLLRAASEDDPRRREIRLARLSAASRNPSLVARSLSLLETDAQRQAACDRLLAAIDDLSPSDGLRMLQEWTGHPVDAMLGNRAVDQIGPRCHSNEDRLELCRFLERLGRHDEAQPIEEELLARGGPSECLGVLWVRWGWTRPPLPAELLAEKARTGPWTTSQRRDVWIEACKAAAAQGKEDLFVDALSEIWRGAPVDWSGNLWNFACGLHDNAPAAEMTKRLLAAGDARLPLIHFALGCRTLRALDGLPEAAKRLSEAGLNSPEHWLEETAGLPRDRLLERMRVALRLVPTSDDWRRTLVKGICNRLRASNRTEDLLGCAELWAETQPRLAIGWWLAPPRLEGLQALAALLAERPEPTPHLGVLPTPPASSRTLPPGATAVTLLAELGLLDHAADRAARAAEETTDPIGREACRMAQASLLAEVGRTDEAMAIELDLRGSSTGGWLRCAASEMVDELFHESSEARMAYIDIYLRDHPSTSTPAEGELRAWEARLGAAEVPDRERATEELRGLGDAALDVLRGLRASSDPEVRARVEAVLEELLAP